MPQTLIAVLKNEDGSTRLVPPNSTKEEVELGIVVTASGDRWKKRGFGSPVFPSEIASDDWRLINQIYSNAFGNDVIGVFHEGSIPEEYSG